MSLLAPALGELVVRVREDGVWSAGHAGHEARPTWSPA